MGAVFSGREAVAAIVAAIRDAGIDKDGLENWVENGGYVHACKAIEDAKAMIEYEFDFVEGEYANGWGGDETGFAEDRQGHAYGQWACDCFDNEGGE